MAAGVRPWHRELHWRCVAATGLELASADDRALVFCFGLLHDTRRINEAVDPEHGPRAAEFAQELVADGLLQLDEPGFSTLVEALRLHSDGQVSSDPTIGTCWDADRLHLPRVSIVPNPALFSTRAAHGRVRLSAAETLRTHGPPMWDALVPPPSPLVGEGRSRHVGPGSTPAMCPSVVTVLAPSRHRHVTREPAHFHYGRRACE